MAKKKQQDPNGGVAVEEAKTKRPIDPNSPRGISMAFYRADNEHSRQAARVAKLKDDLAAEERKLAELAKAKEEAAAKLKDRLA